MYRSEEQTLTRTLLSINRIGSTTSTKGCRQGRDNKLHVWLRVEELPGIGGSAALSESPVPVLRYSMDVNALNYCRFSLMPLPPNDSMAGSSSKDQSNEALIALPNLVESSEVLQLVRFSRMDSYSSSGRHLVPAILQSSSRWDREARK